MSKTQTAAIAALTDTLAATRGATSYRLGTSDLTSRAYLTAYSARGAYLGTWSVGRRGGVRSPR